VKFKEVWKKPLERKKTRE